MAQPNSFLQWLTPSMRWRELVVATSEEHALDSPHLALAAPRSEVVLRATGWLLKQLARGLFLSPALLILKPLVSAFDRASGDLLVVFFVIWVVAFFALLALYIFASGIAYFARRRGPRFSLRLPTNQQEAAELKLLPSGSSVVDVSGTVTLLTPNDGEPIAVEDFWVHDARAPYRHTLVRPFAICPEDGSPVIVRAESAPLLIGTSRTRDVSAVLHDTSVELDAALAKHVRATGKSGELLTLHEGQRVTLRGVVSGEVADSDRFELDGEQRSLELPAGGGFSYRDGGGRKASIVTSTSAAPVVIQLNRSE